MYHAVGLFSMAYLANLKGADEDKGFITLTAQFLQGNWYVKLVHEDMYMKNCTSRDPPACFKHGGTVLMNVHKMYSLEP